jgi:hypothetical protein
MVTTPNPERVEKLLVPGILDDRILSEGYRNGGSFTDFYYHSLICYELRAQSGETSYLRYRLLNGDRGPERGNYPDSWAPKGITFYPLLENDPRSATYLKDDFLSRFQHNGVRYLLQGQLRSGSDQEAVNCTRVWDPAIYPWMDLAEISLTEALTVEELDALTFDANWTAPGIELPLAQRGSGPEIRRTTMRHWGMPEPWFIPWRAKPGRRHRSRTRAKFSHYSPHHPAHFV